MFDFKTLGIRLTQWLLSRCMVGDRVLGGPFKGMRYLETAFYSAYYPKLLGVYEREVVPPIEQAIARKPKLVVNIGAAEGYYSVGLALRLPFARVVAFESDKYARKLLERLARLNRIEQRLSIHGECTPTLLQNCLEDCADAFVLVDIEGAERSLLDPRIVPALRNVEVLLELHERDNPSLGDEMARRFELTHMGMVITACSRRKEDLPLNLPRIFSNTFVERSALLMLSEHRSDGLRWLSLSPHSEVQPVKGDVAQCQT